MTLAAANKIIADFQKYSHACGRLGAPLSVEEVLQYVRAMETITDHIQNDPTGVFDAIRKELDECVYRTEARSLAIAEKGD